MNAFRASGFMAQPALAISKSPSWTIRYDSRDDGRIHDRSAELLHQVQGQAGPPMTRLVIEAPVRIEALGNQGNGAFLRQHGVAERQQRVDRVLRRAAVAVVKVPFGGQGITLEHAGEVGEIYFRRQSFDPQQRLHFRAGPGVLVLLGQVLQGPVGQSGGVAAQKRPLGGDLGRDDLPGQGQAPSRVRRDAKLRRSQIRVLEAEPLGDPIEPVPHGQVHHRNVLLAQKVHRLGGHGHVAAQDELAHVRQADRGELFLLFPDDQGLARLADRRPLLLDIERQGLVAGGKELPNLGVLRLGPAVAPAQQQVRLIGQAYACETAPIALGTIVERRRRDGRGARFLGLADQIERPLLKLRGEGHIHPRAGGGEVEHAVIALIPAFSQQEPLGHKLHALRLVGPLFIVGHAAALGLHRHGEVLGGRDQVELAGQPQRRTSSMTDRVTVGGSSPSVPALCPFPPALDVHQVKESRAVGELIEHSHGQKVQPFAPGVDGFVCIRCLNHDSALPIATIHLSKIGQIPRQL